jgi:fermentation-respiration switch protein FrsA (DUF1100 family)
MRSVLDISLVLLVVYGLVLGAAYLGQRRLMYLPDVVRTAPAAAGLAGFTETPLTVADGTNLVVWQVPAPPVRPTVMYFHGNAGSLASRAMRFARFQNAGWGVTVMAYRGYSGSQGAPSEAANIADALALYDRIVASGVPASSIVLYGESLGSGVATQVAAARPVAGLILDAPYTSTVDVAKRVYWFFPVDLLLADRYENARHIRAVKAPVLIIHGARDATIPVEMGRQLSKLAAGPVRYVEFPSGGHVDLYEPHNDAMSAVREWVEGLGIGSAARAGSG